VPVSLNSNRQQEQDSVLKWGVFAIFPFDFFMHWYFNPQIQKSLVFKFMLMLLGKLLRQVISLRPVIASKLVLHPHSGSI